MLATLAATLVSGIVLAGCVTNDEYVRQLCLDKGIAMDSDAFSDCVVAQKASLYQDRRRSVFAGPND